MKNQVLTPDVLTITFNERFGTVKPANPFGYHLRDFTGDSVGRCGNDADAPLNTIEAVIHNFLSGATLPSEVSSPPGKVNISISKRENYLRVTHYPLQTNISNLYEKVMPNELMGVIGGILYDQDTSYKAQVEAERRPVRSY